MCEISRNNNNRQQQTFCCWGDLRSLQDCVCTHIERDLECSSGGKKKGLEIYFSLFPLPHLSLSLSLNSFTLSLSILSPSHSRFSLSPSSQVTITAQFFSGIIFFRPFLLVGNALRITKDLTKQG
jgi:hypothetical protein